MKDLLKNLFWKDSGKAPSPVKSTFVKLFPTAINEEWSLEKDCWEAVFYEGQIEKIARFTKYGEMEEVRTNIAISELPENVNTTVATLGEVMSAISILKKDDFSWEIIYRNDKLIRYVCYLDEAGNELSKRKL